MDLQTVVHGITKNSPRTPIGVELSQVWSGKIYLYHIINHKGPPNKDK